MYFPIQNNGIMECVEKFVTTLNPKKVILFGSYARGDYNKNSDYDFYIVMSDSKKIKGDEAAKARLSLLGSSYQRPVDIIVETESSFARNSKNPDYVDYYVNKEGVLLYEE